LMAGDLSDWLPEARRMVDRHKAELLTPQT
jgi:hypothetical protein